MAWGQIYCSARFCERKYNNLIHLCNWLLFYLKPFSDNSVTRQIFHLILFKIYWRNHNFISNIIIMIEVHEMCVILRYCPNRKIVRQTKIDIFFSKQTEKVNAPIITQENLSSTLVFFTQCIVLYDTIRYIISQRSNTSKKRVFFFVDYF